MLFVIRVVLWEENTHVIQMGVWVQWFGQDVGWVFACTYPADFAIAVGTILSDGVVSNVDRSAGLGECWVGGKNFSSLVVNESKVGLLGISVEF